MISPDMYKNGRWLRCVGSGKDRSNTRAGAYYAEMMRRCTPKLQVGKYERYKGCLSSFVDFQDFATWAMQQPFYGIGNLDKDILIKGNKLYSKETCVFVPTELNNILTKCNKNRGEYPLGINYDPKRGYKACLSRNSEKVYLGYYSSIEDAFDVYRNAKEVFIKQQAEKWKSQIDPRAYEALMNYQVEITD